MGRTEVDSRDFSTQLRSGNAAILGFLRPPYVDVARCRSRRTYGSAAHADVRPVLSFRHTVAGGGGRGVSRVTGGATERQRSSIEKALKPEAYISCIRILFSPTFERCFRSEVKVHKVYTDANGRVGASFLRFHGGSLT